ncbi:MAG: hypothetical protein OXI08_07595, partial [Cyanobacteria bacterium MAG IRC4_bin_6]|nr:hypothetical protein [Cyanobacteria bacterium MAG IRC4_bin_6]
IQVGRASQCFRAGGWGLLDGRLMDGLPLPRLFPLIHNWSWKYWAAHGAGCRIQDALVCLNSK